MGTTINTNPFWLVVAGEESGDRLGAQPVSELRMLGFEVIGVGGTRMQKNGLTPLFSMSHLAVNGILDVITQLPKLLTPYRLLKEALHSPQCNGLLCIDSPGINLRLMRLAQKRGLSVRWIAPPQIWAWKQKRGKLFQGVDVQVLFPFEENIYQQFGAHVSRIEHPLLQETRVKESNLHSTTLALCPGSRTPHLKRNAKLYYQFAQRWPGECQWIIAHSDQKDWLESHFPISCQLMKDVDWNHFSHAVCPPGTISLELALRGLPILVLSRIDVLTYAMGRLFLQIPHLALPNILLGPWIPEILLPAWPWKSPSHIITHGIQYLRNASTKEAQHKAHELRILLQAK